MDIFNSAMFLVFGPFYATSLYLIINIKYFKKGCKKILAQMWFHFWVHLSFFGEDSKVALSRLNPALFPSTAGGVSLPVVG